MIDFVLRFLVVWFVIYPVLTLVHELAHGTVALVVTRGEG